MIPQTQVPVPPRLRFSVHDRVVIAGVAYIVAEALPSGHLLRRVDMPLSEAFTHEQIHAASREPGWRYDRDFYTEGRARARLRTGIESFAELSAKESARVQWKAAICREFLTMEERGETNRSDGQMEAALATIEARLAHLSVTKALAASAEAKLRARRNKGKRGTAGERQGARPRRARAYSEKPGETPRYRPTVRTLRRWLSLLEDSGHAPWSLRDGYRDCGSKATRMADEVRDLVARYGDAYATLTRPTIAQLYLDMNAEIDLINVGRTETSEILCPSERTLRRYIRSLSAFHVHAGRRGLDSAKRRFAIVSSGPDVTRPLQRVEIDHWTIDLAVILKSLGVWQRLTRDVRDEIGRMHICVAIDVATKIILGMQISTTPTVASVLAVLQMICTDKSARSLSVGAVTPWSMCGTPELIATDAGGVLIADEVVRTILSLGCSHDVPPGGVPGLRGTMERFFHTAKTELVARFAGRTFDNVVTKEDYEPAQFANMDTEDLARVFSRWTVDAYHNTPHSGLGGETPLNAWIRLTDAYGTTPPPDRNTMTAVFGVEISRRLSSRGVRVLGLHYWNSELERHFVDNANVDVDIRVNLGDLGRISVCVHRTWYPADCMTAGLADVSVETWIETLADVRRVHGDAAEVAAPVVLAALREIEGVSIAAQARAGIASTALTGADIERAEATLVLGFTMPGVGGDLPDANRQDALYGGARVTGNTGNEIGAPPQPSTRADDDFFEVED